MKKIRRFFWDIKWRLNFLKNKYFKKKKPIYDSYSVFLPLNFKDLDAERYGAYKLNETYRFSAKLKLPKISFPKTFWIDIKNQ